MIAAMDRIRTAIQTAALVIAVKGSIPISWPFEWTMMSVFWSVRIETSASMKLMVRSSHTKPLDVFLLFLRLTDAMETLYVVYAAMAIAGISVRLTGFCCLTIIESGRIRLRFRSKRRKDAVR